jgi:hypothetical protein
MQATVITARRRTRVDYAPYDIRISAFGIFDVLEPSFCRERVIVKPLQELHLPTNAEVRDLTSMCMGINQARHKKFPVAQTDESDVRRGAIVLREDIVELCALYVRDDPFDVTLWRYAD